MSLYINSVLVKYKICLGGIFLFSEIQATEFIINK